MTEDIKEELINAAETSKTYHNGKISWKTIADCFKKQGIDLTPQQWRSKYRSVTGLSHKARAEKRRDVKTVDKCDETHTSTVEKAEKSDNAAIELHDDGTVTSERKIQATAEEISNKFALLKKHGYNPDDWILLNAKNSIWNVQLKGGITDTFYASKITVKPRNLISTDECADIYKRLCSEVERPHIALSKKEPTGYMLENTLCDLHLNKLCWRGETGNDYDFKIAEKRFHHVLSDIILQIEGRKFDRILFPIGNDFFNQDNEEGTTTGGTAQDNDGRFAKMLDMGTGLLIWAIETLKDYGPVEGILVPGNHDESASLTVAMIIDAYFRNDDNVKVDRRPILRKCVEFGKDMLVLGHGNKEKDKDYEALMAAEFPEVWGRTIFREDHRAHRHSEAVTSGKGSIMRRNPSVTATDKWHYSMGYMSPKANLTYIWHKDRGIVNTITTNIPRA